MTLFPSVTPLKSQPMWLPAAPGGCWPPQPRLSAAQGLAVIHLPTQNHQNPKPYSFNLSRSRGLKMCD